MDKYLGRFATSGHIKGFVAGVISSTILFGIASSAFLYMATITDNQNDYEFDYRGYDDDDHGFVSSGGGQRPDTPMPGMRETEGPQPQQRNTPACPVENVILKVSEHRGTKICGFVDEDLDVMSAQPNAL